MKTLNKYIFEKFKINKDIKVFNDFEKDEKFFTISIDTRFKTTEVRIYNLFTILSFGNNKIKYKTDADKILEKELKLNSNGYYQIISSSVFTAVILKLEDAKRVLEEIIKNDISKEILLKLFDKENKEKIESCEIEKRYQENFIRNLYTEIKKEVM